MPDATHTYLLQTAHMLAVSDCHKHFAQLNCSIANFHCLIGGCNQMCSGLRFMNLIAFASVVHTMTNSGMPHASHTGTMAMQLIMPLSLAPLACYHQFKSFDAQIPQLKSFDAVGCNFQQFPIEPLLILLCCLFANHSTHMMLQADFGKAKSFHCISCLKQATSSIVNHTLVQHMKTQARQCCAVP